MFIVLTLKRKNITFISKRSLQVQVLQNPPTVGPLHISVQQERIDVAGVEALTQLRLFQVKIKPNTTLRIKEDIINGLSKCFR